jgi:hypothetical protein
VGNRRQRSVFLFIFFFLFSPLVMQNSSFIHVICHDRNMLLDCYMQCICCKVLTVVIPKYSLHRTFFRQCHFNCPIFYQKFSFVCFSFIS